MVEDDQPVGIQEVSAEGRPLPDGSRLDKNRVLTKQVLPPGVATTETSILETVIQNGTGRAAAIGQFAAGKTGTTSNYGDAWFVGWDSKFTVAVWVGYPNKLIPMTTDFNGTPVLGGTFPALIWHDFMTSALQVEKARAEHASAGKGSGGEGGEAASTSESGSPSSTPTSSSKAAGPPAAGNSKGNSAPSGAGNEARGGAEGHATEHSSAPANPPASGQTPSAAPPASAPAAPSSPSPTGGVSPGG